jgi:RNA-splicing ligase RtcB
MKIFLRNILLIGGSMETGSYILVGTTAGEQTFD